MAQSVRKTAFILFAAGILVHVSFFNSIHDRITCVGPECSDIRGSSQDEIDKPRVANDKPWKRLEKKDPFIDAEQTFKAIGWGIRNETDDLQQENTNISVHPQQHEYNNEEMNQFQNAQEPVHLVYSSDEDTTLGVVQSIKSVMHYATGPVVFHFVGDSPLPPSLPNIMFYNITEIKKQFKLADFTNPRKRREKDRKTLNSSLANYVRFVMASLLPNDVSKAMWVNADTIIKCDVTQMIQNTFLKKSPQYALAAVVVKGRPQGLARRIKKKYSYIKKSFNAGVFVANLDKWREEKLTEKIRNITLSNRKNNIYIYGSQPPLTLAIGNDFEHLNPSWNVKVPLMNRYFKDHGNNADVCLLHWVGGSKPWEGHGQFREWWKDYGKQMNHKEMVKIAEKNRADKARKWKAKLAAKKEKMLHADANKEEAVTIE